MKCEPKDLWIYCQRRIKFLRGKPVPTEKELETQWNSVYSSQSRETQIAIATQIQKFMEKPNE